MGGHALKSIETVRLDSSDFYKLVEELLPKVKELFETEVHLSQCYHSKDTHGDMDLLLLNTGSDKFNNIKKLIQENFNPTEIYPNNNVYSFDYKNFQIDLILILKNDWNIAKVFYAYDPLPNILGKISYRLGVKFGPDGFRFTFKTEEGHEYAEVLLSRDPKKIFEFLDLDFSKFEKGFDTLREMYEYLISSKYFSPEIFQFENLRHIDRKRNLRRKSYHDFLAFINENPEGLPNYIFNEDKSTYIPMLAEAFPEANLYQKIQELDAKEKAAKEIAAKFNGHLVMERFPNLQGKELGSVMFNFKAKYEHFDEFCSNSSQEDVMDAFALFYLDTLDKQTIGSEKDAQVFFDAVFDENAEPNDALKAAYHMYQKSQSAFETKIDDENAEPVDEDWDDVDEVAFFQSEEFHEDMKKIIEEDTWGKGKPMYYMNEKRQLVEHWKDGTINIIKENI